MAFQCMFASLAVGVGTALKSEDAQNAETNFYESLIGKNGEFCGGISTVGRIQVPLRYFPRTNWQRTGNKYVHAYAESVELMRYDR